jgi:hypothetical protein
MTRTFLMALVAALTACGAQLQHQSAKSTYRYDNGVNPPVVVTAEHVSDGHAAGVGLPYGGFGLGGMMGAGPYGGRIVAQGGACAIDPSYCGMMYVYESQDTRIEAGSTGDSSAGADDGSASKKDAEQDAAIAELQGRQDETDDWRNKVDGAFIFLAELAEKHGVQLDLFVRQQRLKCQQFRKNPKAVKDPKARAEQAEICDAIEAIATTEEK